MKLEYGTLLCPDPIKLSMGTIKQPTLRDIRELSFEKFGAYELYMKITPEEYYTQILKPNGGEKIWDSLTLQQKVEMTMYDLLIQDKEIRSVYLDIFSFFFLEEIVFVDDLFIILKDESERPEKEDDGELSADDICGVISKDNFNDILELLQQVCHIYDADKSQEEAKAKYKNKLADTLMKKMKKGQEEQKKREAKRSGNKDMTLSNIISSVANKHPTLSPLNIWDITVFILLDSFDRIQTNEDYDMLKRSVSVWGDEKKIFKREYWHKNLYET